MWDVCNPYNTTQFALITKDEKYVPEIGT